jgi:hypothetical protein
MTETSKGDAGGADDRHGHTGDHHEGTFPSHTFSASSGVLPGRVGCPMGCRRGPMGRDHQMFLRSQSLTSLCGEPGQQSIKIMEMG